MAIRITSGKKSTIPKLQYRQMGITDDTEEVFIGTPTKNMRLLDEKDKKALETAIDNVEVDTSGLATKPELNTVTAALAERVKKVNGKVPDVNGEVTIDVPEVDTSKLANKTEVILKSEGVGLDNAKSDLLAAIEGGEGTSFNLLSIPRDGSVTYQKTDFLEIGRNMFDKSMAIPETAIDAFSGNQFTLTGYKTSPFISILPNRVCTLKHKRSLAFYNENKVYISGVAANTDGVSGQPYTFTTPSNTYYIRFGTENKEVETQQLEYGDNSTPTENFGIKLANKIKITKDNLPSSLLDEPGEDGSSKTFKILSIGNSFSIDAQTYIHHISKSAGINIVFGVLYRPSETLSGHWNQRTNASYEYHKKSALNGAITENVTTNVALDTGVLNEDWDIITFQQGSADSGIYSTYQPFLNDLINHVKGIATNPDMKIAFHMTWAYASTSEHSGFANYNRDQLTMYKAIADSWQKAMNETDIDILIPCGISIQNARTNPYLMGRDIELTIDGYHLGDVGDFIAGLTFFGTLIAEKYNIDILEDIKYTPVSKFLAYLSKIAVRNALINPFKLTEI